MQTEIDFDRPHNGTATSLAAAESMECHAAKQRREVLNYLKDCADGATREEIERGLGMSGNSVRPRVSELIRRGLAFEAGDTRLTVSGRKAYIVRST